MAKQGWFKWTNKCNQFKWYIPYSFVYRFLFSRQTHSNVFHFKFANSNMTDVRIELEFLHVSHLPHHILDYIFIAFFPTLSLSLPHGHTHTHSHTPEFIHVYLLIPVVFLFSHSSRLPSSHRLRAQMLFTWINIIRSFRLPFQIRHPVLYVGKLEIFFSPLQYIYERKT